MEAFQKYHDTSKQVALTGARALLLLAALVEGPKTCDELIKFFIECGLERKMCSVDTIRIDVNTLKTIGCNISRADKSNGHRYHIYSHPFKLTITNEEYKTVNRLYKRIIKTASPEKLLQYHNLFIRLSEMVDDEKMKEKLHGISILKHENINIVKRLVANEKKRNMIKIVYQPPHGKDSEYDITMEKLGLRSNKLYVYCYNHTIRKRSFLNVSRIKSIIISLFNKDYTHGLDTCITFKLYSYKNYELDDNEVVIDNKDDYILIEGRYFNDFIGIQRMLYFGSDCIVCGPDEIKEQIINKLLEMRAVYG